MGSKEQGAGRKQGAGHSGHRRGRGDTMHLNQTAGIPSRVCNVHGNSAGKSTGSITSAPGTRVGSVGRGGLAKKLRQVWAIVVEEGAGRLGLD